MKDSADMSRNDVQHAKKTLIPLANREGSDQHVHSHGLIRAFSVHLYILQYQMIM